MLSDDLLAALPELFLVVSAIALLMIGVYARGQPLRLVLGLSILALSATLALVMVTLRGEGLFFQDLFLVDVFGDTMKVLILLGALLTLAISLKYLENEDMNRFEFPVLLLFACVGMMMMVSASDLISLYIGLELQSLSLYVLAAFRRDSLRSSEAGLKYFVLGALSSGLLLYGASLIYGFSGTTSFAGIAAAIGDGELSLGVLVGLVFVSAALAFKVSAVPFHMWTPDVYEGAPTPVTAFFATAPKIAALALFIRVLVGPFGEMTGEWQQILVFISIASMALGAFAAIQQRNIKRLMAYSSIGHMGYALVGLAAGTEEGVRGIVVYLSIYLFMNIGTFACILSMRRQGRMVESIDDLKGLSHNQPIMALLLAAFMFSMAGIPPLAGFFGKWFVFLAAINAGLVTLAVIGVLASVVGAFYYLRIIKLMYFDEPAESFDKPLGREITLILAITGAVVLLFWAVPGPLLSVAEAAAKSLFGG